MSKAKIMELLGLDEADFESKKNDTAERLDMLDECIAELSELFSDMMDGVIDE